MKQFGGKINAELKQQYDRSPQWDGEKFINLEETGMNFSFHNIPKMLYKQFFDTAGRNPSGTLPVAAFDRKAFLNTSDEMKFIWYGHSVVLMRIAGMTLLTDPMLGPDASPIAPFSTKRYQENTLDLIDDFPEIDLVLLTHDHYDHLDLASIEKLAPKVKQYFVALGVGRHLIEWGIQSDRITEFDWWEEGMIGNVRITFTPSRHFSGRGLNDRGKSLWGGWTFNNGRKNIYFSGDGGYGKHFQEVGRRLGPFDFAFMECGQYNENWHQIHMFPEESVQAARDAGAAKIMPVHWGGFSLAQHTWTDPVERFVKTAGQHQIPLLTPSPGELCTITETGSPGWWESF